MYRFRDTLPIDISEQTISGDLVTIDNSEEMGVVDSLEVSLSPIQAGSGTPSPDNVRPISGRTEVVTIVSPTTDAEDGNTYTTSLGRTVYGGTLDVVSGVLTVDRAMVTLNGSESYWGNDPVTGTNYYQFTAWIRSAKKGASATAVCSTFP